MPCLDVLVGGLSNIPLSCNDAYLFGLDKEFSRAFMKPTSTFGPLAYLNPLRCMADPTIVLHCEVDDEAQANEGETATANTSVLKLHTSLQISKER